MTFSLFSTVYKGPRSGALLLLLLTLACAPLQADRPGAEAIASPHPLATQAGLEVLAAGGNAFDAAIAVTAALAVVEPYSSGIGGGGFWLLHRAKDGFDVMVDGRERAPLAAHRDMYLDRQGDVVPGLSVNGALAAGIPGVPAALDHIAEAYGRLTLQQSLAPAIRLARNGFAVDGHYRRMAGFRQAALRDDREAASIFLDDGEIPETGYLVRQPDLAATLEVMAAQGRDGFYRGQVGTRLVAGTRAAGGIWTQQDLDSYRVVERTPVSGEYRGMRITSAAPPSSGGIALVTMLNILQAYDLQSQDGVASAHLVIEAMRRAYRDRAEFLGDPDFVSVPAGRLTGAAHAERLRRTIQADSATPSDSLPGRSFRQGGRDTAHFSILDAEGNRVSATLSINYPFGACVVPPGTGVLLNDEMDDFSSKPGVPNVYGLVGAAANAIAPGKRPLSSMSPTFVESDAGVAILGTPGGSRIISMVLLGILDLSRGGMPASWVGLPRFHHQYLPDVVELEPGTFSLEEREQLEKLGHVLKMNESGWGNMQAVYWDRETGRVSAASDPRGIGEARVRPVPANAGGLVSGAGR